MHCLSSHAVQFSALASRRAKVISKWAPPFTHTNPRSALSSWPKATVFGSAVQAMHDLTGFQQRVEECNVPHTGAELVRFTIGDAEVGVVDSRFAEELARFHSTFHYAPAHSGGAGHLQLSEQLDEPPKRSAALADVLEQLRQEGKIKGWRHELFPVVSAFGSEPLCLMERAAVVYFGIKAYGVHVNGWVFTPQGIKLWVARRSLSKPTWPGKLDHIVAGGQPHGLSCADNVLKECAEEASIPLDLAKRARPAGVVSYETSTSEGMKRDVLFVYDMLLPEDFVPTPSDGEVEEFQLLPVEEVAEIVCTSQQFKTNCNLVIIDFLIRHGYLKPDQPGYLQLVTSLRRGDCR